MQSESSVTSSATSSDSGILKIAILAMGGEGGGVLADWIVDLAEHNGYLAQSTSVPGVAQRTGATLYYVELYPRDRALRDGAEPVLALMPMPGDVDVVLASELMEAGRAVQRGLVTPGRTTLIASTHRVYSIAEKTAMGDGRVDSAELERLSGMAAQRFIRFDMAALAEQQGSVISAVLLGALAASHVLPFGRGQFEATIERGGVGVRSSLAAFGAAFDRALNPAEAPAPPVSSTAGAFAPQVSATAAANPPAAGVRVLLDRIKTEFSPDAGPLLTEGVRRLIDYQDPDYAARYLDLMRPIEAIGHLPLTLATARHLALWMSYEDTIRVADLKTRASRFERVRQEVRLDEAQILEVSEYLHPRLQEIAESLPAGLGRWLLASSWPRRWVERLAARGRRVTTTSLGGFVLLYGVAGLRRWRRSTLRYALETKRIDDWLELIRQAARVNPQLALELAQCQRLVKGYGDTHERGLRNYGTLTDRVRRSGFTLAPSVLRELREAALADEQGHALAKTIARQEAPV